MRSAEADAVREFPELTRLADLWRAGWLALWPWTEDGVSVLLGGVPVRLEAVRDWGSGWRDAISIRDRGDVLGIRCFVGVEPPDLVWERTGGLTEVIEGLLMLPPPGDRLAPGLVIGRAPALWVPS